MLLFSAALQTQRHAGCHPEPVTERSVDGLIARNDRIRNASQDAAGLANSLKFLGREKPEIGQDRVHADRAVTLADHAAVALIPPRIGWLELQNSTVIQRDKDLDGRKRRGDPGFGSPAMDRQGFTPDPSRLLPKIDGIASQEMISAASMFARYLLQAPLRASACYTPFG